MQTETHNKQQDRYKSENGEKGKNIYNTENWED